jgi:hypothetical protein
MGLLEKAGKKKDDAPPKKSAKKAKPVAKAVKATKTPKPVKEKKAREPRERKDRSPRVMPDNFQLAGRASKGARRLVDFIISYGGILGLLGLTATGAFFDPTLFLIGVTLPLLLNMIILPMKTNRTVGMFLTRSRYVNHKGNHPHWTHLFLSNLTGLFFLIGLALLAMGAGNYSDPNTKKEGTQMLVFAVIFLLIPMTNYIVTKLRVANGQNQNMYDALYGCWYVVAERSDTSENRWMSRLESLGDWGEKKGWSGSADDDEDAESND